MDKASKNRMQKVLIDSGVSPKCSNMNRAGCIFTDTSADAIPEFWFC